MEFELEVFKQLNEFENYERILDITVEVIMREKNSQANFQELKVTLSKQEKIMISKLTKILRRLAILNKKQLLKVLADIEKISQPIKEHLYTQILPNLFFQRQINNYQLIKFHIDPEQSQPQDSQLIEYKLKSPTENPADYIYDLAKFEWKLEITLTAMTIKKVLRPMILLQFHTKQGKVKSFYVTKDQFQEMRKNLALILRQLHQIELK